MYVSLKKAINLQVKKHDQVDLIEFLNDLPIRLKIKTVMYIFKDAYNTISFLKDTSENFITWICPQLDQSYY